MLVILASIIQLNQHEAAQCLQQIVGATGNTDLYGFEYVLLREDGTLAVAHSLRLEVLTDGANVHQAFLEKLMRNDEVPRGTHGQQPLTVGRFHDTMGECLIIVTFE